jgi:hypothetical protein
LAGLSVESSPIRVESVEVRGDGCAAQIQENFNGCFEDRQE